MRWRLRYRSEAARFVKDFQNITGADAYWFTDPNEIGGPR
jgi:hypothetical protein